MVFNTSIINTIDNDPYHAFKTTKIIIPRKNQVKCNNRPKKEIKKVYSEICISKENGE